MKLDAQAEPFALGFGEGESFIFGLLNDRCIDPAMGDCGVADRGIRGILGCGHPLIIQDQREQVVRGRSIFDSLAQPLYSLCRIRLLLQHCIRAGSDAVILHQLTT